MYFNSSFSSIKNSPNELFIFLTSGDKGISSKLFIIFPGLVSSEKLFSGVIKSLIKLLLFLLFSSFGNGVSLFVFFSFFFSFFFDLDFFFF